MPLDMAFVGVVAEVEVAQTAAAFVVDPQMNPRSFSGLLPRCTRIFW